MTVGCSCRAGSGAMLGLGAFQGPFPERQVGQVVGVDQADAEGVVDVVRVIGQAVGRVHDLGLEQRLAVLEVVLDLRSVPAFAVHGLGLAHLIREIEPGKLGIAIFEFFEQPEPVQVVLEAAVLAACIR